MPWKTHWRRRMLFRPRGWGQQPGQAPLAPGRVRSSTAAAVAGPGPSYPGPAPPSPVQPARRSGLCRRRRPICPRKVRVCSAHRGLIFLLFLLPLLRTGQLPALPALPCRAVALFPGGFGSGREAPCCHSRRPAELSPGSLSCFRAVQCVLSSPVPQWGPLPLGRRVGRSSQPGPGHGTASLYPLLALCWSGASHQRGPTSGAWTFHPVRQRKRTWRCLSTAG